MEFFKSLREKSQIRKEEDIQRQAEILIRVSDFDEGLYISYNGIPLVPIDKDWATKEIIEELSILRTNYIKSRMKESSRVTAVF